MTTRISYPHTRAYTNRNRKAMLMLIILSIHPHAHRTRSLSFESLNLLGYLFPASIYRSIFVSSLLCSTLYPSGKSLFRHDSMNPYLPSNVYALTPIPHYPVQLRTPHVYPSAHLLPVCLSICQCFSLRILLYHAIAFPLIFFKRNNLTATTLAKTDNTPSH